jgi:hypothetical protein
VQDWPSEPSGSGHAGLIVGLASRDPAQPPPREASSLLACCIRVAITARARIFHSKGIQTSEIVVACHGAITSGRNRTRQSKSKANGVRCAILLAGLS